MPPSRSRPLDEAVEDAFLAGLVEVDGELVAVHPDDLAIAEFLVENALARGEGAGTLGIARHELALNDARGGAQAAAHLIGLLGALPSRRGIVVGEGGGIVEARAAEAAYTIAAIARRHGFDLDIALGQFVDEAGGERVLP